VVKKKRSEWQKVESNIVYDDGVFIVKGWVVACDPQEAVLDDQ
jgi:hypothetical protein